MGRRVVFDPIPLDLDALWAVHARVGERVTRTFQPHSESLSDQIGTPVWLKLENLQKTGSFKLRGATNKISLLAESARRPAGVIAASAGNHAQAVAWAARCAGLTARVVMPTTAPLTKVEACAAQGAEIFQTGTSLEEAGVEARRQAEAEGLELIPPYDDWDIIAGQAGTGLEMLADLPEMTVAVVPLGGGGLISGIALALKLQRADIRIIGVQAETVAPWRHYLEDGSLDEIDAHGRTIADGISVKSPGELTRNVIARHVDEIVTVDDNAIAEAIVILLERTRTIGEGAGVIGLAALLQGRIELGSKDRVACVISGGNIDMSLVGRSIDYGLSASGRLMAISVTLSDSPGHLAGLLDLAAELGMNVRDVEHRRGELHVPVGMTEITLELESRDRTHQRELIGRLRARNLAVRVLTG